jgi:shikimate dehydrogenase
MSILSGKAKIAGVMGWPLAHSLSPRLHGYWLEQYGIDGAYVPLPVRSENIVDAMKALPKLGFSGANVTVPHKEAAFASVDSMTDTARRIGAVNTIIVQPDGRLCGDNTDAFGFVENLKSGDPAWTAKAGPAVVFGAGGAARAVCAALLDEGVPALRLCNRSGDRTSRLAADLGGSIEAIPWDARSEALEHAALMVNTTTLGMIGHPPLDLDLAKLPVDAVVTDIVYNPLRTRLLTEAAERGNPVVDGLGMLLHQARPGFSAWFGVDPAVTDDLRAFVLRGIAG